jgi:hypothetical protein
LVFFFPYLQLLFRLQKHDGLTFFRDALQYTNVAASNAVIQRDKDETNQPAQTETVTLIVVLLCFCKHALRYFVVWICFEAVRLIRNLVLLVEQRNLQMVAYCLVIN